ncbi:hypothetical protein GN956_G13138 [Arapaima gigas]
MERVLTAAVLLILDLSSASPPARESYRMPQSALQALSDRGTVVLEAALARALFALGQVASERRAAETSCRGCVPCLFQDCGQRSGPCGKTPEPSCEVISEMQKLSDERERNWAMSQACGFYRRRCPTAQLDSGSCVQVMGKSCSMRAMQCSLLSTMRVLDPPQADTQALCGHRPPLLHNATQPRVKIVGGSLASPGSWPWLVNLRLDGKLMCGGVLVDSSWVVTAAHCFSSSRSENQWTAVVGEFDISKTDPDEQVMKVNRIIAHPKFNPKTFNNDIALVELTTPVMLSNLVRPVCLPSGPDPSTGTPCLVAGWGSLYEDGPSAEQVMEAKVPLLPQSTCKNALGKELVTNTMFCAGFLSGGVDSCQGDSGGPLIYQDKLSGRFQLYGITSWGDGCGEKGKPGVYTRVTTFADWIQAEIQRSVENREPTCPELLKTSELSEEQQRLEFGTLCRFYSLSCPPGQGAACSQLAEDKCRSHFKKCQMRSFLQTLLDLLQRAEDYVRDKVDLTFFTQTFPQLVEHIYSTAFSARERRAALDLAEQVGVTVSPEVVDLHPASLFGEVGPLVADWADYLRAIAEDLDQPQGAAKVSSPSDEKNLFLQVEDAAVVHLGGEYRSLIDRLRLKLDGGADLPSPAAEDLQSHEPSTGLGSLESHLRVSLLDKPQPPTAPGGYHRTTSNKNESQTAVAPSSPETPYNSQTTSRMQKVCPGAAELEHNANLIRDMYRWVLRIPSKSLCMNFQEILVDLASKNKKGLYKARIQATVGGRPLTFYSLVGLENDAFYRSMPRVIALALEALRA